MKNDEVVYLLTIEDVQDVAYERLRRKLGKKELEIVVEKLGKLIPWRDAIENAIIFSNIRKR